MDHSVDAWDLRLREEDMFINGGKMWLVFNIGTTAIRNQPVF